MKESQCSVKTKMRMALAFKELIEENGFDKITVSDITDKCEIHRQTFYYHFQDKYELLEWYLNRELFEILLKGFTFDNMYLKFNRFFTVMYENKRFYQNVLKINSLEISEFISRLIKGEFYNLIEELAKSRNVQQTTKDNGFVFAEFFGYGLAGIVISWATEGMRKTPSELTAQIIHLVETCKTIQINEFLSNN